MQRLNWDQLEAIRQEWIKPIQKENRQVLPNIINDSNKYTGGVVTGLTYPLEISNGSLSISNNADRIYQQIQEVLETRLGERIMRQFFGVPDLVFESFSEELLRNTIVKQIKESLSVSDIEFDVNITLAEAGTAVIYVRWKLNGIVDPRVIRYEVGNA